MIVGDGALAMKLSDRLFAEGVFAQGIAFPTVARDKARVRTIVTATHTRDELQFALDVFAQSRRELGVHLAVNSRWHANDFVETYTQDLTADDSAAPVHARHADAYHFFTRTSIRRRSKASRGTSAWPGTQAVFLAFTMQLSPARRMMYAIALVMAVIGIVNLFRGIGIIRVAALPFGMSVGTPGPLFANGTFALLTAFLLMNLLVLLEVADRLSLKNDLEIAREIQQAMLPAGLSRRRASKPSA